MSEIEAVAAAQNVLIPVPDTIVEEEENLTDLSNSALVPVNTQPDEDNEDDLDEIPAISDMLKVGVYSGDRSCQTDITELVEVNDMIVTLLKLTSECDRLKREMNLTRGVLESEFAAKLQTKSVEIYARMNDKIDELEKMQSAKVATIRVAFKAQLTEALIKVHNMYDSGLAAKLAAAAAAHPKDDVSVKELRRLRIEVLAQEAEISDLKAELDRVNLLYDNALAYRPKTPPPVVVERRPSGVIYTQENMDEMENKIRELEFELLKYKEGQLDGEDRDALEYELANYRNHTEELMDENSRLRNELESMRQQNGDVHSAGIDDEELEKILNEKLQECRAVLTAEWEQRMAEQTRFLEEKILELERKLTTERRKASEKLAKLKDVDKLRKREEDLLRQLARAKTETQRSQAAWEKKFAILKQSLYALKDESYLRQTVQRQAAQLHQASVMYAADQPLGMMSSQLPMAPKRSGVRTDGYSYTVSAPHSLHHEMHSDDENQVYSDHEDLPAGVNVKVLPDRR